MRIARPASVLLAFATVASAVPASAQVSATAERPGWIGVSFDVLTTGDEHGTRTEATITDVRNGSPAARAGLRAGDRLLSVNGMPATAALANLAQTLRPGDRVRVAVERDGRRMEMFIRAVPRPANVAAAPPALTWAMTSDSVVDRMFQAMDSLRLRLAVGLRGSVQVVGAPAVPDSVLAALRASGTTGAWVSAGRGGVEGGDSEATVPVQGRIFIRPVPDAGAVLFPQIHPPFDFYVLSGTAPDSLLREMIDVDRKLRATKALEQARLRTLANEDDEALVLRDEELLRLRQTMMQYEERSNDLRQAVRRAAAESTLGMLAAMDSVGAAQAPPEVVRFRPLTPYRLGQNWVAGAQMVDLKPELATYFQVRAGVLVVAVPEGTPAALAGIQPGDVIVRAGTVDVHSIEDLRTGLSEPGDTLHLQLVRRGRTVRAVLGR